MGNGKVKFIDADQCREQGWLWNGAGEMSQGTLILAHGAGAPMDSPFMQRMAQLLAEGGINVLRFEFPYMAERRAGGARRPPNPQKVLLDCWREVWREVRGKVGGVVAVGGKSMGGRMASLVADDLGVDALVCLGYPFYAAGKPEKPRVDHLLALQTPTLIIQGERDALGNHETVSRYALSQQINLQWLSAADHDLKPLRSSGFTHESHMKSASAFVRQFLNGLSQREPALKK